jgi:ribosomal protein S4E
LILGCDQCKEFWFCGRKCGRSVSVKDHKKLCKKALKIETEKNKIKYELLFVNGANVACQLGSDWSSWTKM